MAHEDSVMAAFQEGETRFLFARYRSGAPGLYELANGTAASERKFVKNELICPVRGCPSPEINTVARKKTRQHFRHLVVSDGHGDESMFHIEGKAQIAKWAQVKYPHAVVKIEQPSNDERERVADVMVTLPGGQRIAIEIQYADLPIEKWQVRHDSYVRQGVLDVWLFGHQGFQLKAGKGLNRVKLNPTHEAVAKTGMPVLWFNPIKLQVASVTTEVEAQYRKFRIAATERIGDMTVEDLDLFALTFEEGLSHAELARLLEARVAWDAEQAILLAERAERMARSAAEQAARDEKRRLKELELELNAASRHRWEQQWLASADREALLELFDGRVPAYLNVDTPGVDLPVPSIVWQSYLYLTFIEPLTPDQRFRYLELGQAIITKFELDITTILAQNITIAWYDHLVSVGVLTAIGGSLWGSQYDVDKYRKAIPRPATPRPAAPSPTPSASYSPAATLEFARTVREANEAAAAEAKRPKLSAAHCRACGGKLDRLLGTATEYHLLCDPNRPTRRRF